MLLGENENAIFLTEWLCLNVAYLAVCAWELVDLRQDVENQMHGLLKGLGLPLAKPKSKRCSKRS
jgi:hypothetical protein